MSLFRGVTVLLASVPCPKALLSHPHLASDAAELKSESGDPWAQTHWQSLMNDGDVQYTGVVEVGGQKLKAVIDTGSFEIVVLSRSCASCGSPQKLYDASKSKTAKKGWLDKQHSYGSGTTYSHNAHDDIKIGNLTAPTQLFWSVYDADMDLLRLDSFAVIFGVGPPTSAIKFAEADNAQVHKELENYKRQGDEITPRMVKITEQYGDMVNLAKNSTSFVEKAKVKTMSACLGKESGSSGWHIWNDVAAAENPEKFQTLKVVGDVYWSASMGEVGLGQGHVPKNAKQALKDAAKPQPLGCSNKACSAMIDTGTSLIVAPSEATSKIREAVDDWVRAGGNCEDVSKLPNLHFKLNGQDFSLPPESYVGTASGILREDTGRNFPGLKLLQSNEAACQALILPMDVDTQFGPLWILGMPFFRKYYTSFSFTENQKWSRYNANSMSMSISDGSCKPTTPPKDEFRSGNAVDVQSGVVRRKADLNVDLSKIRIPHFGTELLSGFLSVHEGPRTRPYIHI